MAPAKQLIRRSLPIAGAVLAFGLGATFAPALAPHRADAQEIVVAPPSGAPMSFANLIEHVGPAVVSIQVRQSPDKISRPNLEGLPPGFEDFFRGQPDNPGPSPTSLGSGFLVDESGVIVTNHHVVEGAEEITVRMSDGRELKADLVGSDELTDIAVLRLKDRGRYPFVRFDENAEVRVGDWVVAVGNPFGLDGTATAGIVSAKGRRGAGSAYVDFLQIDAPINRGNSGGPTFDLQGKVIGVNSQILSPSGGNVGIGFAIPAETAAGVVRQLLDGGRVSRGWLGVTIQPLDDDIARSLGLADSKGALVANVVPDSPAARGGVVQGDVILRFNGEAIEDSRDLTRRVGAAGVGAATRVVVLRAGQQRTLTVRLAERPSQQELASATTVTPEAPAAGAGVAQAALGVSVRPITGADRTRLNLGANENGLVITAVAPGSDLAEKAVLAGDVILQADNRPVRTVQELETAVSAAQRARRPILLQVDGRAGRRYVAAELAGE